jgi:hypothetical protein
MKKTSLIRSLNNALWAVLIAGLLTTPLTLVRPSEADAAFWMGLSKMRLALFALQITGLLIIGLLLFTANKTQYSSSFFKKISGFLLNPEKYSLIRYTLFGFSLFCSNAFISFLILIPQALAAVSAWLAFTAWMAYVCFLRLVSAPANFKSLKFSALFPSWKSLSKSQKTTTWVLLTLGILVFFLYIPLNLRNSESMSALNLDESIMYPIVIKMLTAGEGFQQSLYRFLVYGDYIYGFPFYGWSAFVLLPVKWIIGEGFAEHLQLNILLVRQLANVLPVLLSCFLITWLVTRFKNLWVSIGFNLVLLTLPGVIGICGLFWHPDGVNLFFVVLALYYLDRDQLRFGPNFYFAALACGASIATRLFGVFFFLAIAVLLVYGLKKKVLTPRRAVLSGILFIVVMIGSIMVSNPYLFSPGELGAAAHTFAHRQSVLSQGINEPDPEGIYRVGLQAWWPFMAPTYGSRLTLIFLAFSSLAGIFNKEKRHFNFALLGWLLVIGVYMIGTVKVKSPWYLLPFLIPLYCSSFAFPELLREWLERNASNKLLKLSHVSLNILVAGLGSAQLVLNIIIFANSLVFY